MYVWWRERAHQTYISYHLCFWTTGVKNNSAWLAQCSRSAALGKPGRILRQTHWNFTTVDSYCMSGVQSPIYSIELMTCPSILHDVNIGTHTWLIPVIYIWIGSWRFIWNYLGQSSVNVVECSHCIGWEIFSCWCTCITIQTNYRAELFCSSVLLYC